MFLHRGSLTPCKCTYLVPIWHPTLHSCGEWPRYWIFTFSFFFSKTCDSAVHTCFRSRWESKCSCSRALWLSCMSSRRRVGMPYFCVHPSCIKHIYIKVSVLFQTDTAGLLDKRAAASVQYQCLDCCNTVTSHILWVRIALYTSTHSVLLYLRFWNPRHNLM